MPERKKLAELEMLKQEREIQSRMFEQEPVRAIFTFLDCYNSKEDQVYEIPKHVTDFLAERFQSFVNEDYKSLDETFGNRTATQRNRIINEGRNFSIVFDIQVAMGEAKKMKKSNRGKETPFEWATENVAEKYNMSVETIRDIYKKSK